MVFRNSKVVVEKVRKGMILGIFWKESQKDLLIDWMWGVRKTDKPKRIRGRIRVKVMAKVFWLE